MPHDDESGILGPPRVLGPRLAASAVGAALLAACAHLGGSFPPDSAARPAPRAPESLVTMSLAPPDRHGPPVCRSPLLDPRDRTRLVLVRSEGGTRGDYEPPAGRFGVGPGELLRVDCATGAVIGIVPR